MGFLSGVFFSPSRPPGHGACPDVPECEVPLLIRRSGFYHQGAQSRFPPLPIQLGAGDSTRRVQELCRSGRG
eukprot:11157898-Lingulodinium_polyedra.AAC.1